MAGIYIHIPFCKQACHYCNFHFTTSLRRKNEFITALLKEIRMRREYLSGEPVKTIYFGGGTPSLLEERELNELLSALADQFRLDDGPEITLEANPDDISGEKLKAWTASGINRLSIGVQSFFEDDLRWMNRAHSAAEALTSLESARRYFDNITADLIYGTPGLSDENWKINVKKMIDLDIPHLSCYALTVEPKTPLDKMIRARQKQNTDPDQQADQFLLLMDWMEKAGYEHYEISNFAKPGFRSRHNSAYWSGKNYLGLGPSAHSYNGTGRQWNVANNNAYLDSLQRDELAYDREELTSSQKTNEYIMTSLRTAEGLDLLRLSAKAANEIEKDAGSYLQSGWMVKEGNRLRLTREGKLRADGIAGNLFRS